MIPKKQKQVIEQTIDAHRRVRGGRRTGRPFPSPNKFKKIVEKNAIQQVKGKLPLKFSLAP